MCRRMEVQATGPNVKLDREILPGNVVPKHYDLVLEPNFKSLTFDGTVTIDLDVVQDSRSITLNTLELDIHHAKITSTAGTFEVSNHTHDQAAQTTKITFEQVLRKGTEAKLQLAFTGQLNDKMAGFYRSTYKNADGVESVMATSQMEATDARRAFPCFDEPALKAEFTVTLIADKKMTCLSNMDVASEQDYQSTMAGTVRKAVKFNTSPRMSTYLVALIVSELNCIESKKFRVPVRVFAPPGIDIKHGEFSLDLAGRTLEFYEETFGIEYPLPKLDMVAIPDFAAGAMENWGLITYRVVDLMFDQKTGSANNKERVAEVVQHELAHQWFGNLVTMDFWDGLWLNEGFATWMSWYSCNKFFPEWNVWQSYVRDTLQDALAMDSLRSSHPIEVPIQRADQVNQTFDAIAYSKGSCVLRMISKYLGEDVFMEGVRQYLKKHAYGNTETGDLWSALAGASGKDVEEVMDIWTKHVGHPVLTVTEDPERSTIHVKQNRLLRTADVKPHEDQVLFPVILGLRTKDGVNGDLVLSKREDTFEVPDLDFFKLNADHTSLYRTSYSPARLEKLGQAANAGLLTTEDRAGMIADAGALAACGYQQTSGFLNLLKGFGNEDDFVVWDVIVSKLASIRMTWMFEDEATRGGLKKFLRDLSTKKAHELGWEFKEDEDHRLQQFKGLLFGAAGYAGDEAIVQAAKAMFAKHVAGDTSAIHPNIRGSVFGMVLRDGGEKEFDGVLNTAKHSVSTDERNTALRSLGQVTKPELITRTLAFALDSTQVKDQDMYMVISGLRTHPHGVKALFAWMQENWTELHRKFPPGGTMLGNIIQICSASMTHEEDAQAVEQFFAGKSLSGFEQAYAQSLDAIRAKSKWIARDSADVKKWVERNEL